MINTTKTKIMTLIIGIALVFAVTALPLAGCDNGNGGPNGGTNQTPAADDFDIDNLNQTVENITAVTITPKTGKSTGAITIYYNGSTTLPATVGTYTVTFDVAAATGWKAANGLSAGTLAINPAGPVDPVDTIMDLPPMKDQFSDYFMMGNIFNPGDIGGASVTNTYLTRHYNVLTAENHMKPMFISTGRNTSTGVITYNYTTADNMVDAAIASGFKVVGHTLLWHDQNAGWMNTIGTNKETALTAMKKYVTDVVTHFKGKIHSWDVLNEAFPDGVSASADWKNVMRKTGDGQAPNPWYVAIGSDFVYEGFLAARQADPDAILYYNDYNMDQTGKATMVRNMVRDVNARYQQEYPGETRLLIEGIGMQSHHNTGVTANSIKNSLNLFRPLGVKISISELDVLGQTYAQFAAIGQGPNKQGNTTVTDQGLQTQATRYGEYFRVFLDNADIIERVTFWGVTDDKSWRSAGLPLLFDPNGKAKPAYFKVIETLEK